MSSQLTEQEATQPHEPSAKTRGLSLLGRLFAPVDISSLVFFRVAFGAIMFWEVCRYFFYGWIGRYFVEPQFHFTYYGFDWVRPWPGEWFYLHFLVLGVLAIFVALGFMYRASMALFFLGFAHVFLLEQASYLNHFYLICLVSFLMIFIPAHRAFSVDARLRPGIRSDTVPAWALWLLVAQVSIAYFYGGLAKLNGDWLRGEPMRMWLAGTTDFPLIGPLFTEEWMVYLFSYGGLLLDLLIVPFLLWRRTRPFAFAAAVGFHLMNANLFQIGIFPWFMIAATLLFFPPSWPRRVADRLAAAINDEPRETRGRETGVRAGDRAVAAGVLRPGQYVVVGLLGLYLAAQLLVPLRHHLYPGNVSWTEEGHKFSWHMKLRDKESQARFIATDPATGESWEIRKRDYVDRLQALQMGDGPDMVLQFAHHVADELREQGRGDDVEVRALVAASLNGREPQLLVDPTVDLAAQRRTPAPSDWILPLEEPLPARAHTSGRERIHGPARAEFRAELQRGAEEAGDVQLRWPSRRAPGGEEGLGP